MPKTTTTTEPDIPPDPFDRRPTVIFQAKTTELATWGTLTSLAIAAACACVAVVVVEWGRGQTGPTVGAAAVAMLLAAICRYSILNPPSSIGMNVETRRYRLIKGAGTFKQVIEGTFDDITGVGCHVVESSRGVDGYNVEIYFAGKTGRCEVERHGPGAEVAARERAARLARILCVRPI